MYTMHSWTTPRACTGHLYPAKIDIKGRVTLVQIHHLQDSRVHSDVRVARPLSASIVVLYVPISSYSCAVLCITTEEDHHSVVETFG